MNLYKKAVLTRFLSGLVLSFICVALSRTIIIFCILYFCKSHVSHILLISNHHQSPKRKDEPVRKPFWCDFSAVPFCLSWFRALTSPILCQSTPAKIGIIWYSAGNRVTFFELTEKLMIDPVGGLLRQRLRKKETEYFSCWQLGYRIKSYRILYHAGVANTTPH